MPNCSRHDQAVAAINGAIRLYFGTTATGTAMLTLTTDDVIALVHEECRLQGCYLTPGVDWYYAPRSVLEAVLVTIGTAIRRHQPTHQPTHHSPCHLKCLPNAVA